MSNVLAFRMYVFRLPLFLSFPLALSPPLLWTKAEALYPAEGFFLFKGRVFCATVAHRSDFGFLQSAWRQS